MRFKIDGPLLRARVKSGMLEDLKGMEAKVLLAYLVLAEPPSMKELARVIGCTNLHRTRLAVQGLESRGLLAVREDSSGRRVKQREVAL